MKLAGYEELSQEVQGFIPDYKYLLYDLSEYTGEEIKGQVINIIVMIIMRDIRKRDMRVY
ncbi:conserved hypothetical protein [Desulfitobacterium hafniense DCB-2]|uniref:Transposase (putative) YhgA-like domain-containing protein n=1 Tax=Desulfitobacterium hafniense (strain DSM 10664 / DCB-2) TaxID=272564 RepID=B8FTT5_DESHD|nr:Rpn family recombination-promoting nuclease/putative transposase [Desulfitobacterium hafniense]ACL22177.1 conserved hypothetical protein [Desulfitobacterium hafniense DCB-2]